MKFDLHMHTTESDGRLTPIELVQLARSRGLSVIAVTDHDSVGGIYDALGEAGNKPPVTVIPGVEINTDLSTGELHVLGYFLDYKSPELLKSLEKIRESRIGRARKMVDRLSQLGKPVEWQRVLELARGESICRPHIAQAMLEKGYVSSEREAFDNYIGRNGPAYVEREKLKPVEAVKIIKQSNGLAVLAHPADIADLDDVLRQLMDAGLVGLEAYYGQYDKETVKKLVEIARRNNLLTTGGTDYHHFGDSVEVPLGSADVPAESIRRLFAAAGKEYKLN